MRCRRGMMLGIGVMLLAFVTAPGGAPGQEQESQADGNPHPALRVPRLRTPPELDGRLGPDEWAGAAGFTGLTSHGLGGALAPQIQQPTFYLGYDDKFLYLAMNSPNPRGKYPVAWCGEQDERQTQETNTCHRFVPRPARHEPLGTDRIACR